MFPLIAKSVLTQEVYERYSWTLLLRRKSLYISISLIELALLFCAVVQFLNGDMWLFVFLLAMNIIVPIAMILGYKDQIKKVYAKNPTLQNMEQDYFFHKDYVLIETKRGDTTYQYSEITEIIVAKEDFYIMVGKNLGLPLQKADCSPELQNFILELKANSPQTGS